MSGACEPGQFTTGSRFTKNCVTMLKASDDFQRLAAVKSLRETYSMMWVVGILGMVLGLYVDFMTNADALRKSAVRTETVGQMFDFGGLIGALFASIPPLLAAPLCALWLVYPLGWVLSAVWADSDTEDTSVFTVATTHGIAAVNLFVLGVFVNVARVSLDGLEQFFLSRDRLTSVCQPIVLAAVSSFLGGLVLFRWRFAGHWKTRAIDSSPWLGTPFRVVTGILLIWCLWRFGVVEVVLSNARRGGAERAAWSVADATENLEYVTKNANFASVALLLRQMAVGMTLYAWSLAITSFALQYVVRPLVWLTVTVVRSLIPSRPVNWALSIMGLMLGCCYFYMQSGGTLWNGGVGACGALIALLLWRGFDLPAEAQ